jgi:hypothetical protein
MLIALILCVLWLAAIWLVVGLCASVASGDEPRRTCPFEGRLRPKRLPPS